MKIKKYLPILGIFIFAYLLIKLDISKVFNEIAKVNINFLVIAIALSFFLIVMQTLKWFIIARQQKINVPFLEAVKINLIGFFYGFITPAKVGNIIRANYLKKYSDNKIGKGVGNFILDKVLDLCSLVFLMIMASFFFRNIISIKWILPVILFALLIIILIILMNERLSRKLFVGMGKVIGRLIPEKFKEKIRDGFHSFYNDKPKNKYVLVFFLVNLFTWIILYLAMYFIGLSLEINVPFIYFLIIPPVATLVAQIPITIGGIGTRELTMIGLFGLLGIEATKVFSMSLISLFLGDIIPGIIGFLFSVIKKDK